MKLDDLEKYWTIATCNLLFVATCNLEVFVNSVEIKLELFLQNFYFLSYALNRGGIEQIV